MSNICLRTGQKHSSQTDASFLRWVRCRIGKEGEMYLYTLQGIYLWITMGDRYYNKETNHKFGQSGR